MTPEQDEVVIPGRFNGPPGSAHGGYACGTVTRLLGGHAAQVRLRQPPPLDRPLQWDGARLLDGDDVVAEGALLDGDEPPGEVPAPVSFEDAHAATSHFAGFERHPFPTCFGCGPQRDEGDGLRLFAGPVEGRGGVSAAPWVPHPSLRRDGRIPIEVVGASLDCPGAWSTLGDLDDAVFVLGTMQVAVLGEVEVGQPHVATGWRIGLDGRKLLCGSALRHAGTSDLVGWSHQTWIRIA
jgi:hypothetical protein